MKTIAFETREQWMLARQGKITGTKLKDIAPAGGPTKDVIVKELESLKVDFKKTAKKEELEALLPKESIARLMVGMDNKKGFYELIAERLAVSEETFDGYIPNETPMNRGTRLQKFAVDRLAKALGKPVDERLVLWTREDNESIAYSPDGSIDEETAVETKCLSSASHVEAWLTKEIPEEYAFQKLQAFIVNDKLQRLYFCFYDPRIPCKDFFYFIIDRADVQAEVDMYLSYQLAKLKKVDEVVAEMSGF